MVNKRTLPENPSDYTDEDQEYCIEFFSRKSLVELRRRQELTKLQIERMFKLRYEQALANLQMIDNLLMFAIMKKEF